MNGKNVKKNQKNGKNFKFTLKKLKNRCMIMKQRFKMN